MNGKFTTVLNKFLRTYTAPFTVNEIITLAKSFGIKTSKDDVREFLELDCRVFPLEGRHYITYAGAFSGAFFSFVPTQQELDQKLFVPGDRCIPFVDSEKLSCSLYFEYGGKILPKKIFETDCNTARDLFTFYGDEYSSQYIAADPINEGLKIENNNFELPPKLKLTGVSIEKFIREFDFKKGDRILCRVTDWDRGIIEIFPEINHNKNPFIVASEKTDREQWNEKLENALLESFDRMGPCTSMEQQLSFVFYENRRTLCTTSCGSIHEFLNKSKKVGMELFGVETRLWRRGENVPAIGNWNRGSFYEYSDDNDNDDDICMQFPQYLIDCVVKDQLFENKNDIEQMLELLLPSSVVLSPKQTMDFTLQIIRRNAIISRRYNKFADFALGPLRHRALDLYSKVGDLVYEIDCAGKEIENFPQQELVTLSQLFSHISRILEMFASCGDCDDSEKTALKLSLEGMEYNFEDIQTRLKAAVDRSIAGQFKVI